MIFFLDENFPKAASELLRSLHHEVIDIRNTPDEGITDDEIFRKAQEASAILLTTDLDFSHTIPVTVDQHCGVVVIALRQPNRVQIMSKLQWFLDHLDSFHMSNAVIVMRDQKVIAFSKK